jgi:hypothetical protein
VADSSKLLETSLLPPTTLSNRASSSTRIFRAKARIKLACMGPNVSVCASNPSNAPACAAAPSATTSSGSTNPGVGDRPKVFSANRRTAGVFVAPPTNNTWSNGRPEFFEEPDPPFPFFPFLPAEFACSASKLIPAAVAQFSTGMRSCLKTSEHIFSNKGRDSFATEPPGIGMDTSFWSLSFSRA